MLGQLLATHFVHVALAAGLIIAILSGLLGPLVVVRNNAFAVHGIAELGLTGAAGGLLIGLDATTGALIGSLTVGLLLGLKFSLQLSKGRSELLLIRVKSQDL